jgi:hypothetical protein
VAQAIRLTESVGQRSDRRAVERRRTSLPGRLVWRDGRRATRFATVLIRNVSESGAYVECVSGTPIPLYRLVFLQAEREAPGHADLPGPLREGRVLSAVYRVAPPQPSTGVPQGYALRLLVESRQRGTATSGAHRAAPQAAPAGVSAFA